MERTPQYSSTQPLGKTLDRETNGDNTAISFTTTIRQNMGFINIWREHYLQYSATQSLYRQNIGSLNIWREHYGTWCWWSRDRLEV